MKNNEWKWKIMSESEQWWVKMKNNEWKWTMMSENEK